jgi:hypothetical protein
MAFAITCDLTGTTGRITCGCPPEHPEDAGHHDSCDLSDVSAVDLHEVVGCAPDCCDQHGADGHGHDPKECLVEHPPGSCPQPSDCRLWKQLRSHQADPDAAGMPKDCPGGHHGYGVEGCVVCHPLTITFIPDGPRDRIRLRMTDQLRDSVTADLSGRGA